MHSKSDPAPLPRVSSGTDGSVIGTVCDSDLIASCLMFVGKRGFGDAEDLNAECWHQQCRIPAEVGPPLYNLGEFGDVDRVTSAQVMSEHQKKPTGLLVPGLEPKATENKGMS
ncbi:hypothetical protein Nepgr_022893 [Nepenthes gracilis]|uniref:Uncharacterized protein n=1 Tax=Nepenthes gracilis TaxID=150966 RepID=A0AAD3T3E0_NEPGR|nr:hypothetical protein Nepgr_022893 [Nepenthes gracilis]